MGSLGDVIPDVERIALFLDYENLAIGAREALNGAAFDLRPISDALAERGRVVARRAYADWSMFDADRRMLTRNHVELIEMPQRMGAVRKNAADIKMAVDAVELALEHDYVTTFVIGTGDSDFTPLVHKLRELDKRVIGVGVKASTSALLPPACDEFLFFENLEGVEPAQEERSHGETDALVGEKEKGPADLDQLVTQTIGGLQRSADGPVLSSSLKRALMRKDPTFSEADYGFRAFGELMHHLAERNVVILTEGSAKGDPAVEVASNPGEAEAFSVLVDVVGKLSGKNGDPVLSGLKNQVSKRLAGFNERRFGYNGFLQFVKAAQTRGLIQLDWDQKVSDYRVRKV